jgi:hypothetical protein
MRPHLLHPAAALLLLAGCSGTPSILASKGTLEAEDFAVPGQPPPAAASIRPAAAEVITPEEASEGILDVTAAPSPPMPETAAPPLAIGAPVLVDAKVGSVNGRPIYASRFLEPMGPRLKAQADELSKQRGDWRERWRGFARQEVERELNTLIEDELLRAEALAGFSPEQKQGFFAFMRGVSDRLESENLGSRSAANRRLSGEGMTVEQWLESQRQKELIGYQLHQKIWRRIHVSWRDIRQTYQKFVDMRIPAINPVPTAKFRRIAVPAEATADIEEVTAQLARAVPFAEIASSPLNQNNRTAAGLQEVQVQTDRATFEFFGHPEMNAAAQTMAVGSTAGPFKVGSNINWLHLEAIEGEKIPLYDAQMFIERHLRDARAESERRKYIERLKSKATVTAVPEMTAKLVQIAEARYLPPAR